jgi:hypothetical protein
MRPAVFHGMASNSAIIQAAKVTAGAIMRVRSIGASCGLHCGLNLV